MWVLGRTNKEQVDRKRLKERTEDLMTRREDENRIHETIRRMRNTDYVEGKTD